MPADPRRIKDLFVAALDLDTHRSGGVSRSPSAGTDTSCATARRNPEGHDPSASAPGQR